MIIGICGFIGSGKDTIADYLANVRQFRRISFAGTLKDAVSAVFGWDRELLEGRTQQSRAWREQRDQWWSQRLDREITPRQVLQQWGTEVCRQNYHDEIWVASVENRLRNRDENVVITDCRFPNEIRAIKQAGGLVIRVRRGPDPMWYGVAVSANQGDWVAQQRLQELGVHASETAWVGTDFDAVIDNNDSFDATFSQVEQVLSGPLQDRQPARASLA
jgi:hypothetical protein